MSTSGDEDNIYEMSVENPEADTKRIELEREQALQMEEEAEGLTARSKERGWMLVDRLADTWACISRIQAEENETGSDLVHPMPRFDLIRYFEEAGTPSISPVWMTEDDGSWIIQWQNAADTRLAIEKGNAESAYIGQANVRLTSVPISEPEDIRRLRGLVRVDEVWHLTVAGVEQRKYDLRIKRCHEEEAERRAEAEEVERLKRIEEQERRTQEEEDRKEEERRNPPKWTVADLAPEFLQRCISRMYVMDLTDNKKTTVSDLEWYAFYEKTDPGILTPVVLKLIGKKEWFAIWRNPEDMWAACETARTQTWWKSRPSTIVAIPVVETSLLEPILHMVEQDGLECESMKDVQARHDKETERRKKTKDDKDKGDKGKPDPKTSTPVPRRVDLSNVPNPGGGGMPQPDFTFAGGGHGGDDDDGDDGDDGDHHGRTGGGTGRQQPKPNSGHDELDILGTSILTGKNRIGYPKLSQFRGTKLEKGDVTYTQYKYEIQEATTEYNESIVKEAIRRSVKGTAMYRLRMMGKGISLAQILQKFDIAFGSLKHYGTLMEEFYLVTQKEHEDVTQFATRLEEKLESIVLHFPEKLDEDKKEREKRERIYLGLREEYSLGLEYIYEDESKTYDYIYQAARKAESKMLAKAEKQTASGQASSKPKNLDAQNAAVITKEWLVNYMKVEAGKADANRLDRKKKKKKIRQSGHLSDQGSRNGQEEADDEEDDDDQDQLAAQVGEAQTPATGRPQAVGGRPGAPSAQNYLRCYKCQGFGHFARECTSRDEQVPTNARELNEQQRPGVRVHRAPATQAPAT